MALRRHADASEERTQGTLTAVHDTLQKIVERLTNLEAEFEDSVATTPAPTPTPAPSPAPEAREPAREPAPVASAAEPRREPRAETPEHDAENDEIVGRIAAVSRAFKNEIDDNTPLAPGSGRPTAAPEGAAGEAAEPAPAPRVKKEEDKPAGRGSDFIAAARRAAQVNTAESRGARLVPDADQEESGGLKPVAVLKQYKRPLMIAAAIVIVALGAVQVVNFMKSGKTDVGALLNDDRVVAALPPSQEPDASPAPAATAKAPAEEPATAEAPAAAAPEFKPQAADPIETGSIKPAAPAQDPALSPNSAAPAPAAARPAPETAALAPATAAPAAEPAAAKPQIALPDAAVGPMALRQAAAGGDADAQYEVAVRFTEGYGVKQDVAEAAKWYRLAAAQGLAPAQYRLGSLYEKGDGVEKDLNLARTWYQRAAEQGNRKAMHNLAVLYADGIDDKPDYERAAIWFRQAAEYGLPDSQYNLAILYARGMGVTQDLQESYKWFGIAASQGDGEASARQSDVASRIDADTVAKLDKEIADFEPKPLVESANAVKSPDGGWGDAEQGRQATLDPAALIRTAQSKLVQLGYNVGQVDGQMGPKTREAVRSFQRANALPQTGEVDAQLLQRLQDATS